MIEAFLLTRQWRDDSKDSTLELWFSTPDGPLYVEVNHQRAVAFVRIVDIPKLTEVLSQRPQLGLIVPSEKELKSGDRKSLKNVHGEKVIPIYHPSYYGLRDLENSLSQQGIALWETDIRPPERFLMERFITAGAQLSEGVWRREGTTRVLCNPIFAPCRYRPELRLASVDIETSMDAKTLYSIGVVTAIERRIFLVGGCSEYDDADQIYIESHATEKACLNAFFRWTQNYDPDIFIGWNVVQFDFRVLSRLCEKHKIPLAIGRANKPIKWREDTITSRYYLTVPGRLILDGIEVLKTAMYNFNSFSLNSVAQTLLDKSKLISHDDRGEEITRIYREDKLALARYNIQDCQLVWDIFQDKKLIEFSIERAQLTGLTMDRSGGTVASFEYAYLPRLHRQGYVAPNFGDIEATVDSPGGYVLDSIPGIYQNILVLDFKSLYPSIIRTFNIDPFANWRANHENLPTKDCVEGFHGARFARKGAILPGIIQDLWRARDAAKKDNNQPLSQAIKIIMNSFYGVLGSPGCRFFDPKISSSITMRGHQILQQSKVWVEAEGYTVIYGDTDSIFIWIGDEHDIQNASRVGNQLANYLNLKWQEYLKKHFTLESQLEIEFETHYTQFVMPTIRNSTQGSKKRYAGLIKTPKGDKLIFKGLENARSDWTDIAKAFQQSLYQKIFAKEPVELFIRDFVKNLYLGTFDQQLIYRKRLRRELEAYLKNIPPHAQAAKKLPQYERKIAIKGEWVQYVLTSTGPEPCNDFGEPFNAQTRVDHCQYVQRQIKPIADGILQFVNLQFDRVIDQQLELF